MLSQINLQFYLIPLSDTHGDEEDHVATSEKGGSHSSAGSHPHLLLSVYKYYILPCSLFHPSIYIHPASHPIYASLSYVTAHAANFQHHRRDHDNDGHHGFVQISTKSGPASAEKLFALTTTGRR